jgi:hypothetical protein
MKIRKKSFAVEYKLVLFPRVYTRVIYSESKLHYCICDIKVETGIHGWDSVSLDRGSDCLEKRCFASTANLYAHDLARHNKC